MVLEGYASAFACVWIEDVDGIIKKNFEILNSETDDFAYILVIWTIFFYFMVRKANGVTSWRRTLIVTLTLIFCVCMQ